MGGAAARYLDLARSGRNEWWRYLAGIVLILVSWLVLGFLPYAAISAAGWFGATADFVGINLGILVMLAALLVVVRAIHRRPLATLVSPDRCFDWARAWHAAVVWAVLALAVILIEHLLYPGRYRLTLDWARFVPFLVLVTLLTPLQSLAEELLFRGYLMQSLALLLRRPMVIAVASSVLFALPHLLNPEVERYGLWLMAINYFVMGMLFALVTLRDGRLELAIGIHASNNLMLALFANYEGSALETQAVFTAGELDPIYSLVTLIACGAAFWWWMFGRGKTPSADVLSRAELAQFERDGYVVVRGLVPAASLARMHEAARSQLAAAQLPLEFEADVGYAGAPASRDAAGGGTVRRLLQACDRDASFREWALAPAIAVRLRQLLGPAVRLARAHHNCVMTKNPAYSSLTGWHRDIRYWSFERPQLVSVWTALGPERRENGCLLVLPGTHRIDVPESSLDAALFLRSDLPENQPLLATATEVELDAGDVLFFHCRLFHAAGRNETGDTKLSAVFTYHAADNRPLPGSRSASIASVDL